MSSRIGVIFSESTLKQFGKFVIVGGWGTLINLALLYIFTDVLGYLVIFSQILALIVVSINNFILNKVWTFNEKLRDRILRKYIKFLIISVIAYVVNLIIFFFLTDYFNLWIIWAELLAIISAFTINFSGSKLWIFHLIEEEETDISKRQRKIPDDIHAMIFLPTYNEKDNISKIIDLIKELPFKKEILIVDDSSTDGTLEIVKEKYQQYRNIKLIVRKGRKGRGLAGITALRYFIDSDCNVFVELDADFSHHPIYIPEFLRYFPEYDVIIGSRLIKGGREHGRTLKRFIITLIANILIRFLFGTNIKDCTSGFRAFKKEIIQHFNIRNFFSIHYSITEEILYACILNKAKIKEIPIIFYERKGGDSKLDFKKIFYTILGIIKIIFRGNRIIKN